LYSYKESWSIKYYVILYVDYIWLTPYDFLNTVKEVVNKVLTRKTWAKNDIYREPKFMEIDRCACRGDPKHVHWESLKYV
jgi:hypothetical protein